MSEINFNTVKNCLYCGSKLTLGFGRGKSHRKYCNNICSSRYHAKKQKLNPPTCNAPNCFSKARSAKAKYCELHYGRLRRSGTLESSRDMSVHDNCIYCGKKTMDGSNKYCSSRCASRFNKKLPNVKKCRVCAKDFAPIQKNVCCSDKCREELERVWSRAHYARWMSKSEQYRNKVRNAEYKRKALKQKAFVEVVEIEVVFARDNGICWLCGEDVNPLLKWPNHGYATLDHVIPLSKGGKHSYDNIKLAHMSCNCKKGAKLVA